MNLRPTDELDYETTRVRHAASPLFGYARIWTSKATTCGPANNRNCGRSPLSRERWPSCPSHDQVYIRPREFVRNFRRTVIPSFRPPRIDLEVARFGPTQFAEPLHENREPWPANRGGSRTQESESSHSFLLRARRVRPRRRAAEQSDEVAALHAHSITSSACASRLGGAAMPIALAVGRLMTNSNLVD
jgi:hypothetical protein